ncbi:MAG TPA: hypothetical protein VEB43_04980 [Anaeromyxobacter sp.]|nr:hypothetical protein [Anaeromyxobacter sp.]
MRRSLIHAGGPSEADLFYAELMGVPLRRPRPGAAGGRGRPPAAPLLDGEEDLDGGPTPSPAPSTAPTSPAPAAPAPAARDVAVTETMALVVADAAPLPVTPAERTRVASDAGARDDYRSVCAIVPRAAGSRLLVFFHGNDNYVTVAPDGASPPRAASRPPRWADAVGRAAAARKPAAALHYRLDRLPASQRALADEALRSLDPKDPVVLVPEDAQRTVGRFWSVPPRGQYGTGSDARSTGPGTPGLGALVAECDARLRALPSPAGRPYLDASAPRLGAAGRVYLAGHSGGGKPLVEAAGSELVLGPFPSSGEGGGRAAELWLLDCTYGWGTANYVTFCERWLAAGRLAHRADAARLVCVYRPASPQSNTETEADALRTALARRLRVTPASLLKLHDASSMTSASMAREVIPALTTAAVVFVRTAVAHDAIPTQFMPLLLRTAAS